MTMASPITYCVATIYSRGMTTVGQRVLDSGIRTQDYRRSLHFAPPLKIPQPLQTDRWVSFECEEGVQGRSARKECEERVR